MKKIAPILLISMMMLVVACQGTTLEATVAPEQTVAEEATPAAEEEPMVEVSATGNTMDSSPDEELAQMTAIAPPPQVSDREPGIHTVPCLPEVSFGVQLVEGEDYTCGLFTVPQHWDDPDGRNLDLGFVVVNAIDDNPEPDPLLHLAGGPGASAILAADISRYRNLQSDRDIILYDIRGAGLSQRIGFAECLVLAMQNGASEEQIEALWAANATLWAAIRSEMPAIEDLKIWEVDFPLLNKICWAQFTGQGFDLNQFSTASNARDAVELIKALGYDSFNIHGASYGTRQAMTIMDVLPEIEDAPQLRAVVLDSTFPPSVNLIRTIGRSHHDFVVQLLEECQADAACNAAYPNLKARLATLLDKLAEEPLTANGETVTIDDVVNELTNLGGSRAAYLPKLIAELETGGLDTYLALRAGEVGTDAVEALPLLDLDMSDPVQAFVADSLDLLSGDAALEFAFYVNIAFSQEDPMVILQAIIEESYSGEIGDQMLEMLGTLTTGDFANSPYVLQQLAAAASETDPELNLARSRSSVIGGIPRPLYSSVHCIDDIQHERFEDAVNSYNDLQFPQLTNLVESRAQAGRCENWPVAAAPIEVKDPVNSDVPVIILQGAYDGPTPVYMGRRAARELENSTYVLVPQQGHGTWTRADDCVGQIASAFIQNPDAALDLSCLDARRPQWALPGNGELTMGQLTADKMMNATFGGIYDAPVTLIDGVYEGEPFVEGGVSQPVVTYVDNTLAHGDLDGDGLDDAVVLLIENSGGSGAFSYVGAQLNRDGQPADAGAALLGDRVQLIAMQVEDGEVFAEIVTQGPGEGLCCGTLKLRKTLGLQGGQLAEVASEELGTVSLDDLMSTQWRLHRLNFDQEPLVDVTIAAEFAEGMVSGTGGCNSYSAGVTSSGGQLLAVAPVATTAMACDDELEKLEAEYLAALQSATEWRFYPGQLAIGYIATGGDQATLFFTPVESADSGPTSE